MELWQLRQRQILPMEAKIIHTQRVIRQWHERQYGDYYVSFSGGKDSTVLLKLVREMYPNVPAVFINTGLEFPEIRQHVKSYIIDGEKPVIVKKRGYSFEQYEKSKLWILRPKTTFVQVISQYGYPIVSKEVSECVDQARKSLITGKYTYRMARLNGELKDKNGNKSQFNHETWKFLLDAPFKISAKCCNIMKKNPVKMFERLTGLKPIIGTMADESRIRTQAYLRTGCNSFESKRPISRPMSIWTEQDVLHYIKRENIAIASVYGDVINADLMPNGCYQGTMFSDHLVTTGESRTGCMFCMFGCHLDKGENRFQRMKRMHPQIYDYCMNRLGIRDVLDFIGVQY